VRPCGAFLLGKEGKEKGYCPFKRNDVTIQKAFASRLPLANKETEDSEALCREEIM